MSIQSLAFSIGLLVLVVALRAHRVRARHRNFDVCKGIILDSHLASTRWGKAASFRYVYFTPEERIGHAITPTGYFAFDVAHVESYKMYPVGAKVEVYFDPNNPADAFLEHTDKYGIWTLFLLASLCLMTPVLVSLATYVFR